MILEPKFVDYGSIHSTSSDVPQPQHNTQYNIVTKVNPSSVVLPLIDDEDNPNTSTKTKMVQGKDSKFMSTTHRGR